MTTPPEHPLGEEATMAVLIERIDVMGKDVKAIKHDLENNFVTQKEYAPVKQLVWGAALLILTLVLTALVVLVTKGG